MKRLRVLLLSLLILVIVVGGLPATISVAKWSRRSAVNHRKKLRQKRHSRAWWRRHRARQRARRERALLRRRERALAAQPAHQPPTPAVNASLLSFTSGARTVPAAAATTRPASRLPFEFTQPYNWRAAQKASAPGETVFAVQGPDGRRNGTAVLAPVSVAADAPASPKTKTVGGTSVTALRRTVIDRMVAEGGWVTNDFVREMNGRRVFVVLAQTGAPGAPSQSWTFYFTELDGRVYSLATTTPVEFAAPVAASSEQFMASLRAAAGSNLATQK